MAKPQTSTYSISWIQSIANIDRHEWDALAKPLPTPFLE
jgi:predicted N-acyltransferase